MMDTVMKVIRSAVEKKLVPKTTVGDFEDVNEEIILMKTMVMSFEVQTCLTCGKQLPPGV